MIEIEQSFLSQCRDELNGEKRIACRLLVNQLRQRNDRLCFATKRIRNQLSQVSFSQRFEDHLAHNCSRIADRFELAHQRMCGIHFVVSIGTDQHQVPDIWPGQKILE